MATLPIRRFPDPLLKQPARAVARMDSAIYKLILRMVATMRANRRCVGLAAPQVGVGLRIAVMDVGDHPKAKRSNGLLILVNPTINSMEGAFVNREGCLSVPDLTANVRRAIHLNLKAFDQFGSSREYHLEEFEAIVAQHELDHLDGRLFLDRVANLKTDIFRRKTYL